MTVAAVPVPIRVLMVCTGNICRSPTAEVVLRKKLQLAGLSAQVRVDSAGTHDYHVGQPPDSRAQAHALRRGYDLSGLRARVLRSEDFERFDWLLAMDGQHLRALRQQCSKHSWHKLQLLTSFANAATGADVPDPYRGDEAAFETVLDLVERAVDGLVRFLDQSIQDQDRTN